MARKSDFTYHINKTAGVDVLVILDLDNGGMSVTNNVEAVVKSIAAELGDGICKNPIIYRDSTGTYDGIDGAYLDNPFYSIGKTDENKAATVATERYWEAQKITFVGDKAWRLYGDDLEPVSSLTLRASVIGCLPSASGKAPAAGRQAKNMSRHFLKKLARPISCTTGDTWIKDRGIDL